MLDYFCEEGWGPEQFDPDEVIPLIDSELDALARAQATWPDETDCDRLDASYAALRARGIIALHNAGYTQSDGFSDCAEVYHDLTGDEEIVGCCFYHEQDLERALEGDGLYIAFGALEKADGADLAIGQVVRDELERVGL